MSQHGSSVLMPSKPLGHHLILQRVSDICTQLLDDASSDYYHKPSPAKTYQPLIILNSQDTAVALLLNLRECYSGVLTVKGY